VKPTQADSEIEEEHLLNFVVNSLDEELAIDLGENVEVTTETLYEVPPAPAPAGPQSTTSAKQLTTRPTPIPSVDISPTSLSWTPLRRLGTHSCNEILLRHCRIGRWRSSPTSTWILLR